MDCDAVFLIDRVIEEEGFYGYNMYITVEKHLIISIAPVRSRSGPLVICKKAAIAV
jgi:uncharacterized protein (UPF0371 family)